MSENVHLFTQTCICPVCQLSFELSHIAASHRAVSVLHLSPVTILQLHLHAVAKLVCMTGVVL